MTDNDNINQRLDRMDKRLDVLVVNNSIPTFQNPSSRSDEIDLFELFSILWQGKWWIIGITFLFAVAGVVYALSLPNMYKSEGVYVPAKKEASNGLGQLGGLAGLAGVNLGGGGRGDIDQALALVGSWSFLEGVVQEHNLAPYAIAIKRWDPSGGELVWDESLYDPASRQWNELAFAEGAEPKSYDIYLAIKNYISVTNDSNTGMITISVTHYSAEIAEQWVNILVGEINEYFQKRDAREARENIVYLEKKISETNLSEMQGLLYSMIESHIQTLMLAEVGSEYLLKEVIPPKKAERRSKPSRVMICILFFLFGGFVGFVGVLLRGVLSGMSSPR